MNMFILLPFLAAFALILVVNELLDRYTNWPREYHRKFGHILSGLVILSATYYLNQTQLIVFGVLMLVGAVGSRLLNFKSIHDVARRTYGTSFYALSCIIMAVLWGDSHIELFRLGVLVLTVPDALAAIVGSQWGKQLPRFNKSVLGSVTFFCACLFVVSLFTQTWWIVIIISLILTLIEFFSQWGIDNLLLPLSAGYLLLLLT